MIVPTSAHAKDDEVCTAWVHIFIDAEVTPGKPGSVTFTSEERCLQVAGGLDDLPSDGNPFRGGPPEISGTRECAWLEHNLAEMQRALADAQAHIAGAIEARDAADTASHDAQAAYEAARNAWLHAQNVTAAAKLAYEAVYDTDVEVEKDSSGYVVIVRHIGYRPNTSLGRAVLAAIDAEAAAKRAMDLAWAKWNDQTTPAAQAAQFRVDQYENVLQNYPDAIAATKQLMKEDGCK
ncbi:MAG: hypothetical protein QM831_21285 [Kofleriaceae bacterium]